jgi:glucose 1-dehydrogenase
MKAIGLIPGTKKLCLLDIPEPSIAAPDEIKIKILEVGICGTDREEAAGGRADAPAGKKELIIGHEMFGQVVEVGTKVKSVRPGDHAVFTVRRGCGKCIPCNMNRSDMCLTGEYTERGIKGRDGYQAEYVVDKEQYMVKVPAGLEDLGVLTEPASVAEKAIDEAVRIQELRFPEMESKKGTWLQGKKALVTGLGPIGLLAAFILRLRGAEVTGMDIVDEDTSRPEILKKTGGKYIDGRTVNAMNLGDKLGNIDLIFEGTGVASLEFELISSLGINGIYLLSGIPSGKRKVCTWGEELLREIVLNNQIIVGSVNAGIRHYSMALEDLGRAKQKWGHAIHQVISEKAPFTDFERVLKEHPTDDVKVVLEWSGKSI